MSKAANMRELIATQLALPPVNVRLAKSNDDARTQLL
jgi:hypothetical protein